MLIDMAYADALTKAEHLKALGDTTIYMHDENVEWAIIQRVETGNSYRMSGPCSCYLIGENNGLTFKWSIEFEKRDANGSSVSLFDAERLREVILKLPKHARDSFCSMLQTEVLPEMEKRTAEWRGYMQRQWDSEDCVRGLIAFGKSGQ